MLPDLGTIKPIHLKKTYIFFGFFWVGKRSHKTEWSGRTTFNCSLVWRPHFYSQIILLEHTHYIVAALLDYVIWSIAHTYSTQTSKGKEVYGKYNSTVAAYQDR